MSIFAPKYITVDEFKDAFGQDLREILRKDNSSSDSFEAERFLGMVEDTLMYWINHHTVRRLNYDLLGPEQTKLWKKALLTHAYFCWKNGFLGLESGVDTERGSILDQTVLDKVQVAPITIEYLSSAGLYNLVMKNSSRSAKGIIGGFYQDGYYF